MKKPHIAIFLGIIASILLIASQNHIISNEMLETILIIVSIVSGLATILVFFVPESPSASPTAKPVRPTTHTRQPSIFKSIIIGFIMLALVSICIIMVDSITNFSLSGSEPTEVVVIPAPPTLTLLIQLTPTPSIGSTMRGQDGMTLLYVPEGEFLRGSKDNDPDASYEEKPQRLIYLDAFWIDQTEVTNEIFARFVEETGYQTDAEKEGTGHVCVNNHCKNTEGAYWLHPQGPNSDINGLEQHPGVQVNWNDAKAYCGAKIDEQTRCDSQHNG